MSVPWHSTEISKRKLSSSGKTRFLSWALIKYKDVILPVSEIHCRFIFTMGFSILVRWHLYIEPAPGASQVPIHQQTECRLTNRLGYRGSSEKHELDSPPLIWLNIQPTWRHGWNWFTRGFGDICICCLILKRRITHNGYIFSSLIAGFPFIISYSLQHAINLFFLICDWQIFPV